MSAEIDTPVVVASVEPLKQLPLEQPPLAVGSQPLRKTATALSKALTSPKTVNNTPSKDSPVSAWLVFYFYHSLLITIFVFMSLIRNVQYGYNRVVLRFFAYTYAPSKSPQLIRDDVLLLSKLPKRVSTILTLKPEDEENGGIDGLMSDCGKLAAWSLASGIPHLSFYETSGAIKEHTPELTRAITKTLSLYFGPDNIPTFSIRIPRTRTVIYSTGEKPEKISLRILLLSREDGKPTIVALTKSMARLAAEGELDPKDVTISLVDGELTALVGHEPDLLIQFGPILDLQSYPPWHIRLSEIYWDPDNNSVNYAVFYRALRKYSLSKINVGK
ncbi:hypothetical protein BABINDRAFT_172275 [Babjeviella inositovora NRRL Y-12698]|uniref:ditrans,polycis-polyprenyl diphosphate synthase [(2E,6E)-farnesyldiphosphate specific] n=1 Tax=Babjeviella inositovora NRRL Y-12698 TaxID=984486 RepID=A0A1E3QLE8_9ASCO|nr:uncharacterized protein BABINDRAFT_172275 [Babjeviella inositovora NRRL Y-12698]ODQ78529.1 hypothetical protein BABINDRAFT_172275 [Babjeviella inositovora NRRL Y-12698]